VLSEDPRARRLRVTELLAAGVDVDWACDVEEALFRATCVAPDVIVLDGPRDPRVVRDILDRVAAFGATRRVPVVLRSDFALSSGLNDRCAAVVRGPSAGAQIVRALQSLACPPR
jgi:hypothetical protein